MTERYYTEGTEPDILPHYASCHGPCHQGDKECPCPMACESPDSEELGVFEILGKFVVGVLALIGLGVLVGYFA